MCRESIGKLLGPAITGGEGFSGRSHIAQARRDLPARLGIAVDLNPSRNPYHVPSYQDPHLVEVTGGTDPPSVDGGHWPDAMRFEDRGR